MAREERCHDRSPACYQRNGPERANTREGSTVTMRVAIDGAPYVLAEEQHVQALMAAAAAYLHTRVLSRSECARAWDAIQALGAIAPTPTYAALGVLDPRD